MSNTPAVSPPPSILALPGETVSLKSSQTRMTSPTECRRLVQMVIREDSQGGRAWSRVVVKACYDGNAPYSKKPPGHAWTANINFLGMEGLIDSARIPYYALFSGVPTYTTFTTNYQRENPDSEVWNRIIEEEWTDLLNRWKQFRWHNRACEFEMLFEGYGVKLREDPTDWRFKAVPSRCVYVPVESPSCLDERVPFIVIRRQYRIHELYAKIADEESARARGWNVEAVRYAIMNAAQKWGGPNWQQQPWELWQQRLKNHELTGSYTDADIVRTAHVLNQEYAVGGKPGKVSHFIISEGYGGDEAKDGYLFADPNAYDHYHQVVLVSFQNTGDGTWHSVRGLAYKSFRHIELQNRTLCRAIDNAFLAAGPIIQETTATGGDVTQMAVIGPITVIKPGATFVDHRLGCDIQGVLAVNRVIENNLAQNIGHYNQRSTQREDGRGEQPTATAVELQAGKETQLGQAQIDSYYDDKDTEYEEMFACAIKGYDRESQRFLRNCEERGVPKEAIMRMGSVKANRISGYPSPEMRKRHLLEFGQFVTMLPEDGKRAFLDELIIAFFGPDKLKMLNPSMEKPDMDTAMATIENAVLEDGIVPTIVSGMDHVKHLQIMIAYADEKLSPLDEAVKAGQPVPEEAMQEAYEFAQAFGIHADAHLEAIQNDPTRKAEFKLFQEQIEEIFGFKGRLRSAILEAQHEAEIAAQQQEQATALDAVTQARVQSAAVDDQIKVRKAATDTQIKVTKAQSGMRLKTWQAGENQRLKAIDTASNIALKTAEAKNKPKKE